MTLSIIIVNYNVKLLLKNCLASVAKAIENIEAEVIIVDNASTDHSISYLQPMFSQFKFLVNHVNEGFAKANNKALAIATGEFILFLNPDTEVPRLLYQMHHIFQQSPRCWSAWCKNA